MSKCTLCRKAEALDTPWERFCRFLCVHIFAETVAEIRNEKFNEGFGRGYESGFGHSKRDTAADMMKMVAKVKVVQPTYEDSPAQN